MTATPPPSVPQDDPAPAPAPAIVIEDLRKSYGHFEVLKGVSLSIARGDFATILGPSGSGKTTILRCLAGLENADSGRIWLDGNLVFDAAKGIDLPARHRRIGMIFQNYALWPHMTVAQHVRFPLARRRVAGSEALVAAALKSVGLHNHGSRFPHELSGGQQQRVAVARAIVGHPAVLLMDEPLSNLDVQLRLQLRDELKAAHVNAEASSVFVTHDQSEAFALSDHIVIMHDGEIIQHGRPDTLRMHPRTTFVAEFLGVENILPGRDLQPACTGAAAALDPAATYAFGAAALTDIRPAETAGWLCFDGCTRQDQTFDGTVHATHVRCGALRLTTKSLARPVVADPDGRLWLRSDDLIRITND